ncbi:unnamed protein product, partial [Amoebophrya sp. A25]
EEFEKELREATVPSSNKPHAARTPEDISTTGAAIEDSSTTTVIDVGGYDGASVIFDVLS